MLAGFGNGLADAAWNAWMGNMVSTIFDKVVVYKYTDRDVYVQANPNEILGFLHAFYGLGAVIAPIIATTIVTKGERLPWYYFYYVMIALAAIEVVSSIWAFWGATGDIFRANNPRTTNSKDNRMKESLVRFPHARVTWICALFLLGYVGIEVALGGWIVKCKCWFQKVGLVLIC